MNAFAMANEEQEQKADDLRQTFISDKNEGKKSNVFLFKERYEINFNTPLEWLNANDAKAFKVTDKVDNNIQLHALICNNETSPRLSCLPYFKSIDHPSLMKLIDFGVVDYAPEKSRNMALIYQTPLGGRVIDNPKANESFHSNHDKLRFTILKLLGAAETINAYDITHRAIRLDNLYYKDLDKTEIVLGDCLASFPAYHQPPAYETIESLMAQKDGRGDGSSYDDFYAIAAVGLSLYLNRDLIKELTPPEVLRQKLKKGSYITLISRYKIPNQLSILLKGLLNDDEKSRWSYIQTYNYLEGKQNLPYQSVSHERPRKSVIINGEKVHTPVDVVFAMRQSFSEAFDLIKSGKITDWIKNNFDNEDRVKRIEKSIKVDLDAGIDQDIVVSKVCILIAPNLPIATKDLSLFPDGTPKAIFHALKNKKSTAPFTTLISSELIKVWYQEQETIRSPANANEFKIYINRKDVGYGLDRIMYDFDEDLPCISPLLGNDFVNSSSKVLKALDTTYANKKLEDSPYDNTIIAYLRCKMGKKLDPIIIDINSKRDEVRAAGILQLYTNLQKKYGPPNLPNLGIWLINFSKSIIKSYNNKKFQKYLEREILRINKSGKLIDILNVLENVESRKKDKAGYAKAQKEVIELMQEKNRLQSANFRIEDEARSHAMRFASVLAVLTMVTSLIINLINLVI